jgi:hypothetical protein
MKGKNMFKKYILPLQFSALTVMLNSPSLPSSQCFYVLKIFFVPEKKHNPSA